MPEEITQDEAIVALFNEKRNVTPRNPRFNRYRKLPNLS